MSPRLLVRLAVVLGAVAGALAVAAAPAAAHPLGNFSVNQYHGLRLYPDRVEDHAVVDFAEIPTVQERGVVDGDGDGTVTDAERSAYAARECPALAAAVTVTADEQSLRWTVAASSFTDVPATGGLSTTRLTCTLTAALATPATVDVTTRYRVDRVGWREIMASGDGVALPGSPVPAASTTDELRRYPDDLLSSPLDVRSVSLRVVPGTGSAASPEAGPLPASPSFLARAERTLRDLAGGRLTPLVGFLAVLLALVLGAGHAALPGHGKTVMAAYLAGRRGRPRDAVLVGATVTASHTGAVLLAGLVLSLSASLAGETLLAYLGIASGVLVTAVGIGMLATARRGHAHTHSHSAHSHAGHSHSHHHGHDHGDRDHSHRPRGRLALVGMGLAGGLVPSPSALVVLLGAVALGRTAFGVGLVVAYGLGMAATLTAAGLVLVRIRDRWRPERRWPRLARLAPSLTGALVLLVGLSLAARAVLTVA